MRDSSSQNAYKKENISIDTHSQKKYNGPYKFSTQYYNEPH